MFLRPDSNTAIYVGDIKHVMDALSARPSPETMLDSNELTRYHRFVQPDDAARFLVGRSMIKTWLARALECRPDQVVVSLDANGRPFVCGAPDFSLSHGGNLVALAIASYGRIGVDIEPIGREPSAKSLARKFATSAELARITTPHDRYRHIALWCMKEAVAKAIGLGMQIDFHELLVETDGADFRVSHAVHGVTKVGLLNICNDHVLAFGTAQTPSS